MTVWVVTQANNNQIQGIYRSESDALRKIDIMYRLNRPCGLEKREVIG